MSGLDPLLTTQGYVIVTKEDYLYDVQRPRASSCISKGIVGRCLIIIRGAYIKIENA